MFPTRNAFLFLLVGLCNGSLVDAIYFEYPWFELSQPEGVNLVLSLAFATAFGCVFFFVYLAWDTWAKPSINIVAVWVTLTSTAITFLLAFTWSWSINGVSISILSITCISSLLTALQWSVLFPWVATMNDPRYLSQYMAGEWFIDGISCILEIFQEPADLRRITPREYFLILAMSYCFAICALAFIIKNNIGNPIEFKGLKRGSLMIRMCPRDAGKYTYWMCLILWNSMLNNCFLQIILPYVADHTGDGTDGTIWLQWSNAIYAIANLIGTFASYSAVKGWFCLTETAYIMTTVYIPIAMAALGIGNFSSRYAQTFLQLCLASQGLLAGWQMPLIFRDICNTFPDRASQLSSYLSYWIVVMYIVVYGVEGMLRFVA